ncbi:MAG: ThuA domain-containing protein [Verrucomicrobiales bacterium]|nr:ThuA domain-containing protein [Verrucomicrobiales bacterium]
MKNTSLCAIFTVLVLTCLASIPNAAEEKELSWPESSVAKFKDNPTVEHRKLIDSKLPEATAEPGNEHKVLVFYRCEGFVHTSIPFGNYALEAIARDTGAFSIDLADEYSVFTEENLAQYDGIIFNNTTHLTPNDKQRKAILDFIHSGKGVIGIHAAADNFGEWSEGVAMIGGIFDGHPWTARNTWAFKVEDPQHPLNAAFKGKGFWHRDEIYWYNPESFEGREKLRVLLSLDMSKRRNADPFKGGQWKGSVEDPTTVDVPVSWCRKIGEGRLFYTNLGHNDMTFANTVVLQHMLDGIQFALGDIDVDTIPSDDITVEIISAPGGVK